MREVNGFFAAIAHWWMRRKRRQWLRETHSYEDLQISYEKLAAGLIDFLLQRSLYEPLMREHLRLTGFLADVAQIMREKETESTP